MVLCVKKKAQKNVLHVVEIFLSSKYISTDSFSGWNKIFVWFLENEY